MAVVPVNLARVSNNLRVFNLLESVRRNTANLYQVQNQFATGLRISTPSEDPLTAAKIGTVDRHLEQIEQIERNLTYANSALAEGESAMLDAVNLLMEIEGVASETAGDTVGADERQALSVVVDSILDQLISVGNRQYLESYLFSGHYSDDQPFELVEDGVIYRGDEGRAFTIVDTDLTQDAFTFSGAEFFAAVSTAVQGVVDLDPALTEQTRISDLRGTTGNGVTLGRIAVNDGTDRVEIDLSGADTVGDLIDKLNAEMPATLQASFNTQGITIGPLLGGPADITITDVGGGQTARDLGIAADGLSLAGVGVDLDPRLTLQSSLADLNGGLGLSTADGLTIRNGSRSATLDFTGAETIEDVMNLMNGADVGVWARIAADGSTIEVVNRISGSSLTIEENGGSFATLLGVRSLHGGTELSVLNDGRGVETLDGNDLRIITADGSSFEVDVDGAETLQDVIALLNAASGGAFTADLTSTGNGLLITDNTAGAGTLTIERVNLSPALDGLGLDVQATGNTIVGRDVNPIRVDNSLTALLELREGLERDDTQEIAWAGQRLESALKKMQEIQGQMAAQAQAMDKRSDRIQNETTAARVLLSDVRDVDLADAVVRFQQMQTALQANLATSSRVMDLSLLDYM